LPPLADWLRQKKCKVIWLPRNRRQPNDLLGFRVRRAKTDTLIEILMPASTIIIVHAKGAAYDRGYKGPIINHFDIVDPDSFETCLDLICQITRVRKRGYASAFGDRKARI